MKKSKGIKLTEWTDAVFKLATEKQIRSYVDAKSINFLYHEDVSVKGVFDHVFALIEDAAEGKILVIYPLSKRSEYPRLLNYKGYSERAATAEEIASKQHCIATVKKREKKDLSTPLFGDLPEVRKQRGF